MLYCEYKLQHIWVIAKSTIAVLNDNNILSFVRSCHTVFQSGHTILPSHQQWIGVSLALHPRQLLVLLVWTQVYQFCTWGFFLLKSFHCGHWGPIQGGPSDRHLVHPCQLSPSTMLPFFLIQLAAHPGSSSCYMQGHLFKVTLLFLLENGICKQSRQCHDCVTLWLIFKTNHVTRGGTIVKFNSP
jgi:hypothetical protein